MSDPPLTAIFVKKLAFSGPGSLSMKYEIDFPIRTQPPALSRNFSVSVAAALVDCD
jgi:hypothetical protein